MQTTTTTREMKPIREMSDSELQDLLCDVDRALRIAGDDATGMTKFRWAILTELTIRASR